MTYKLLHKLFGWDYVAWASFADNGVARVHSSGGGEPYYWRYKTAKIAHKITSDSQVIWLTCHPSKYLEN